jgi:hypothetical protein
MGENTKGYRVVTISTGVAGTNHSIMLRMISMEELWLWTYSINMRQFRDEEAYRHALVKQHGGIIESTYKARFLNVICHGEEELNIHKDRIPSQIQSS